MYKYLCTPRLTKLKRKCFAYNSRNVLLRIKKNIANEMIGFYCPCAVKRIQNFTAVMERCSRKIIVADYFVIWYYTCICEIIHQLTAYKIIITNLYDVLFWIRAIKCTIWAFTKIGLTDNPQGAPDDYALMIESVCVWYWLAPELWPLGKKGRLTRTRISRVPYTCVRISISPDI